MTFGAENFREALARKQGRAYGREINPDTEILVTCGGTEAMMSAMMTVCNPGDKVIVPPPQTAPAAEARAGEGYDYVDWYFSTKTL